MAVKSSGLNAKSGNFNRSSAPKNPMTLQRASLIQSKGGNTKAGTFEARAQAAGNRNVNTGVVQLAQAPKP